MFEVSSWSKAEAKSYTCMDIVENADTYKHIYTWQKRYMTKEEHTGTHAHTGTLRCLKCSLRFCLILVLFILNLHWETERHTHTHTHHTGTVTMMFNLQYWSVKLINAIFHLMCSVSMRVCQCVCGRSMQRWFSFVEFDAKLLRVLYFYLRPKVHSQRKWHQGLWMSLMMRALYLSRPPRWRSLSHSLPLACSLFYTHTRHWWQQSKDEKRREERGVHVRQLI